MSYFLKFGLALLIAGLLITSEAAKDDTVKQKAIGKEVTEAVIRMLAKTKLFKEDYSFFIRLAYVETRFGHNENTFREDYYGGIWAVEESVFRLTQQNHTLLTTAHRVIQNKLGIDYQRLTWKHLQMPLHSGLAAALYFHLAPEAVPDTLAKQEAHWRKYYRPLGLKDKFINDSRELQHESKCRGKMDLTMILDGSGSVGSDKFLQAKNFLADVIQQFTLDFTRFGVIVYSSEAKEIFPVNNTLTIPAMSAAVKAAVYPGGGTQTHLPIIMALDMHNTTKTEDGRPQIMTVFTDGDTNDKKALNDTIPKLRNSTVQPIAVGIGSSIRRNELELIALGDTRNVFMLSDFDALDDFVYELSQKTCEAPQLPGLNKTYDDSLVKGEKRVYKIRITAMGLTISVNITVGKIKGFWSRSESLPSAAVNDGEFEGKVFIPPPGKSANLRQAEEDDPNDVYFAIEGVETRNDYKVGLTEGGSGAAIFGLSNAALLLFLIVKMIFNFENV